MYYIALVALFFLCMAMFYMPLHKKYALFFVGFICLNGVQFPVGNFANTTYLLSFSFFLSELKRRKVDVGEMRQTVIVNLLLITILASVVLALTSPRYTSIVDYGILANKEMVSKTFIVAYSFLCIRAVAELRTTIKMVYYSMLVLTVFGIFNWLTRSAIWVNAIKAFGGVNTGDMYMYADRFRVQAMFSNPFDYGFICVISLLLFIYAYNKGLVKKSRLYVIAACAMFGILFCGSRTILFCIITAICAYLVIKKGYRRFFLWSLSSVVIIFLLKNSFSFISEKLNYMFSVFDSQSTVGGSSLELRNVQIDAVMQFVNDRLMFGRGLDFYYYD